MKDNRLQKLLWVQSLILIGGTVFAWTKLLTQFDTFYSTYGTLFRFRDCVIPNPLATACFYGSLAFVVALVWSVVVLKIPTEIRARRLRNFLLFCVLFAGSVVSYEVADFYKLLPNGGIPISCTPGANPLVTPCFYGMLFFIASFVTAIFATRRLRTTISEV